MKIKLGQRVKDLVSGFVGMTTARTEYLNGCIQFSVTPPVDKEGKKPDGIWFDEEQLEYVGPGITLPRLTTAPQLAKTGGDQPDAPPTTYRGS